jgi:hypothetical protein
LSAFAAPGANATAAINAAAALTDPPRARHRNPNATGFRARALPAQSESS